MNQADSILFQLGGAAFQMRTGVRNPQPVPCGITLDLPAERTIKGANRARITLHAEGYAVEIMKTDGRAFRWIDIADGIPAEELPQRFAALTGLEVT